MYAQGADFLDSRKLNHLAMLGTTRPKDSQPPKTINSFSALASTLEISTDVEVGKKAKDMDSSLICRTRNSMTIAASGALPTKRIIGPRAAEHAGERQQQMLTFPMLTWDRVQKCGRQTCASSTILWPMLLSSAICLWWNLPHPSRSRSTALARHHATIQPSTANSKCIRPKSWATRRWPSLIAQAATLCHQYAALAMPKVPGA